MQETLSPIKGVVDIASLLTSLPQFSTLASLLHAADLVDALSKGSLTMFAPTNDAFAKLPDAFMEFLNRLENKQTLVAPPWRSDLIRLKCTLIGFVDRVQIVFEGMWTGH